jgi:methylenetetrahydrofolate reductase (NADPH)
MPAHVIGRFAGLDDDARATHDVAADVAAEQITELVAHGVRHVHLYTLNRAELALSVCERLGLVESVAVR